MPLLRKYPQNEDILCYFTYMQNTAQYVPRQKQKKNKNKTSIQIILRQGTS